MWEEESRGRSRGRGRGKSERTYFEDFEVWPAGTVSGAGGTGREGELAEGGEAAGWHDGGDECIAQAERGMDVDDRTLSRTGTDAGKSTEDAECFRDLGNFLFGTVMLLFSAN